MIEEYVPYEIAKSVRELGFNEECSAYYAGTKLIISSIMRKNSDPLLQDPNEDAITAPTFRQLFKWFKKAHGFQVFPDYFYYDGFHYGFKWVKSNGDYGDEWRENVEYPKGWDTNEESEIESINFIIKKIKNG